MELWRYTDNAQMGWQHPMEMTRFKVNQADPLISQLEHFCRIVKGEEKPIIDGRDGTQSLAVALAVLESIRHQVPIMVSAETNK